MQEGRIKLGLSVYRQGIKIRLSIGGILLI